MEPGNPAHPKSLDEAIAAACRMPVELRARGDVSWNDLERESGYSLHREEVTEDRLAAYLEAHGELVGEWVGFSEGQRSTPNWGVSRPDQDRGWKRWTLFYYAGSGSDANKSIEFDDPARACAAFIKRRLDQKPTRFPWGCVIAPIALMAVALFAKLFFGSS